MKKCFDYIFIPHGPIPVFKWDYQGEMQLSFTSASLQALGMQLCGMCRAGIAASSLSLSRVSN